MAQLIRTLTLIALIAAIPAQADAEVYVIKNRDGSITFTSRQPAPDQSAEIFKPKEPGFSIFSVRPVRSKRLYTTEYRDFILDASRLQGVDPSLVRAVIHAESEFNPWAKSRKGAMGLMQLMPATAKQLGVRNAFEPWQNIQAGVRYLSSLLDKYRGDVRLALAAYNAGPESVDNYGGVPPFRETKEYVKKVIGLHQVYKSRIS